MPFVHLSYNEHFAYTFFRQQLPLSQLKSFKDAVVCCTLCGTGSQLRSYTSVFPQKTIAGTLGTLFVPLSGMAVSQLYLFGLQFCCQSKKAIRGLTCGTSCFGVFFPSYMHDSLVQMSISLLSF